MKDTADTPGDGGGDAPPEITLVSVRKETFYLVEGEEHLDQLLLADGVFPQPILCVHFETIAAISETMGRSINMAQYWQIHPEIIARLRDTNVLIERVA